MFFCMAVGLLAFAEKTQVSRDGLVPASALWLLQNAWELHAVVHSYSKPLVVLLNGRAGALLIFFYQRFCCCCESVHVGGSVFVANATSENCAT